MKKLLLFSCLIVLFISCKKEKSEEFLVSKIEGLTSSQVYMSFGSGKVDTIPVVRGQFKVKIAPEDPTNVTLFFPDANGIFTFYGDNGSRLIIQGSLKNICQLQVIGDSINQKLSNFRKSIAPLSSQLEQTERLAEQAWVKDSLSHYEALMYSSKMSKVREDYRLALMRFVNENRATPQAVLAVREFITTTSKISVLNDLWPQLAGLDIKGFPAFLELKRVYKQMKQLVVGKQVGSIQAYSPLNKIDYFYPAPGRKTLILFWNTEDKYSAFLNKKLADKASQLSKDSINYVGLSTDDDAEVWAKLVKPVTGRQLLVRGGIQHETLQQLGVTKTPCLLLLGNDAKITKIYEIGESPLK